MTLYEQVLDFGALQALFDEATHDENGDLKPLDDGTRAALMALAEQWKADFEAKIERTYKYRCNIQAEQEMCLAEAAIHQAEADRLKAKAQHHDGRRRALDFLIMNTMGLLKIRKVERPTFTLYLQKNPPSMNVLDESKIPAKYWEEVPATVALKKGDLKKDLVDGVAIEWVTDKEDTAMPGAVIVQTEGVRTK